MEMVPEPVPSSDFRARLCAVSGGLGGVNPQIFPQAKIITYGSSIPASAPLIEALANVRDADGKITDYTKLLDGYGSHLYPVSSTTLNMVEEATGQLLYETSHYPHGNEKPIWITEWNPSGSSWWNGQPWYFQYDASGQTGGDLNKADARGVYKAMDRAGAIRAFNHDVVEKLRSSAATPVNISHVFYYAYDSAGKSPKCDHVKYSWTQGSPGLVHRRRDRSVHRPSAARRRRGSCRRGALD